MNHTFIHTYLYRKLHQNPQEIYLRIPGAADYGHELDVRISTVLAGKTKPKEPLDNIYQAWDRSPIATAEKVRRNSRQSRMERRS